jgi:uncharacterized protein with HEPN domain
MTFWMQWRKQWPFPVTSPGRISCSDEKTIFATVRALEIIGEAAKHIPQRVKQRYPDLPWREMMAVRDKVIHAYFGVDGSVIWKTVHEDIPPLLPHLRHILLEIEGEGTPQ